MKDGFYLSTYLNLPGIHRLTNVWFRHDHNMSLWEKSGATVRLAGAWEFERASGQKMHRTPFRSGQDRQEFVNGLLAPLGVKVDDLVEIWGTPGLASTGDYHLVAEVPDIAYHSVCHLYSAMLMDSAVFFDGTVVGMAVDRGPDRLLDGVFKPNWYAGGVARRGTVAFTPVQSPGVLYCEARDRFRQREGTLMALATATSATGRCDREAILRDFRFLGFDGMAQAAPAFDRIHREVSATATTDPAFSERDSLTSAVMKEVQAVSVLMMERNVERLLDAHDVDPATAHLALAGGYALNCPTNSHLMARYGFRGLLAPPCVGDSGQSIGIALAAFHKKLGRFDFAFPGPYLGTGDQDLAGVLREYAEFVADVRDFDADTAVADLRDGPVAWFHGRSECGPRALGNRSLLADPTSYEAKQVLNDVKRREWWRPVAPVVLAEHLDDWFEDARPSPFMLETFTIRPDRRSRIPAVAHLDYSARIQSVTRAQNPVLYDLVAAFHRATGVPMLCNTSLNDKGEPIIDTIAETVNFCLRRGVPIAYVNGRRIVFRDADRYAATEPLHRNRGPFLPPSPQQDAAIRAEANPFGLSDVQLFLYLRDLELTARHDIRTADGADAVRRLVDGMLRADPDLAASAERQMTRAGRHFTNFGGPTIFDDTVPALPAATAEIEG